MQVIVIPPQSEQGLLELKRRVAKIHAECIAGAVNRLGCPTRQKLLLMDAAIRQLETKAKEATD